MWTISEAENTAQSLSAAAPATSEDVWDTVKFSFEIEEVTAAVFWKETAKVSTVHGHFVVVREEEKPSWNWFASK